MTHTSLTAQIAMLLWIPIGFLAMRSWPALRAAMFILIGGALFLPQLIGFDFPILPPLGKNAVSLLLVWGGCALSAPEALAKGPVPARAGLLALLVFSSSMLTAFTNQDALQYGPVIKKAMTPYDGFVFGIDSMIMLALPVHLGQRLVRNGDDLRYVLRSLVIGALVYVPFVLLEGRMAPFLHRSVYGYFQHDWAQAKREGGFRAFVFMSHALSVALFMSQSVTTVAGLSRLKADVLPFSSKLLTTVLVVSVIACKSLAAALYALTTVPLMWFGSARMQLRICRMAALFVLAYPILRLHELVPLEWFVDRAIEVNPERASSLSFRFHHEAALLEKASQRLWLGWGGWGRSRAFNEDTGLNVSVVDGQWIVDLGGGGLFRFLLVFGTLMLPILAANRAVRSVSPTSDDARTLATASMLLALVGIDLLPNSLSHPLPLFLAGALTNVSRVLRAQPTRASFQAVGSRAPNTAPS